MKIPVFRRIGPEFQCLEAEDQKSNVQKDKATIRKFRMIRSRFQCLEG